MKNVHDSLVVKNMSNLVLKEIYGKYQRKSLTEKEIRKNKMTEKEVFKKYDNLSENKLNSKNNKEVSVRNNVITNIIVRCRGEKKRVRTKK